MVAGLLKFENGGNFLNAAACAVPWRLAAAQQCIYTFMFLYIVAIIQYGTINCS